MGPLAQSVEQRTFNPWVVGSIPTGPTQCLSASVYYSIVMVVKAFQPEKNMKVLAWIGVLTTLAINPWFAFDPINLPKMLILSTGSAYLFAWLLLHPNVIRPLQPKLLIVCSLFVSTLAISFLTNPAPWYQQLWGTWGRSTGLITYTSFVVVLLFSFKLASSASLALTRVTFERLGYFVSIYTLIQLMDLDPINWSQKLMVATLGNINFMSSFLGLTTISYTSRVFLERLSVSAKLFFIFLSTLNIFLIIVSKSIQGLGVYAAGLCLMATFWLRHNFGVLKSIIFFLFTLVSGLLVVLGTASIGPLSILRQETVLFRIDYWQAGINMVLANPFNGVGLDSYGDYYRQYRTVEAVIRTGPQRVTNTAHNIFLDVFSGSGVLAGLLMLFVMVVTFLAILKVLQSQVRNSDFNAIAAMWLGFVVFCLVSINQIGVGIWGFIFMGLINGFADSLKTASTLDQAGLRAAHALDVGKHYAKRKVLGSNEGRFSNIRIFQHLVSGSIVLAISVLSLAPNIGDARFGAAVKSQNLELAQDLLNDPGMQDFHSEHLISILLEQGNNQGSLNLALSLTKRNPQNWQGWVQIISNPLSSRAQQNEASENLLRLDPKNELLRRDLETLLSP